jgi:hypothetical protein
MIPVDGPIVGQQLCALLQGSVLGSVMAHDIDHNPVGVCHEETPDAPWFIRERVDNLSHGFERILKYHRDIFHFNGDLGIERGSLIFLDQGELGGWVVG